MKLSFDYLKDEILKFKAQSFLQQGSIIILRSIFKDAEEKFNSSAKRPCNTAQPAIQLPNAGAFILLATEVGIEAHLASKLRRAIVQQAGA